MVTLRSEDPLAVEVCEAIRSGDVEQLRRLLASNPRLVDARITPSGCADGSRPTLLHIAADWPGHLPNVAATIEALVDSGADVNARFIGPHTETALHWRASSDDIAALDALLAAGTDIEAQGAVIGGGTPLADAVAFGQWLAARRLIERGAQASLWRPRRHELSPPELPGRWGRRRAPGRRHAQPRYGQPTRPPRF